MDNNATNPDSGERKLKKITITYAQRTLQRLYLLKTWGLQSYRFLLIQPTEGYRSEAAEMRVLGHLGKGSWSRTTAPLH